MSKQEYSNQAIAEYLLGSLSEAEAEHFDELNFTDEEFADHLKSAEQDLVDSYVQGELAGTTLEKFKSHYLASPLRRAKVEFAQAFQVFAQQSITKTTKENSALLELPPRRATAGFFAALNIFAIPRPALKWGLTAAALAFVFLGGWLWMSNIRLGQPTNDIQVKQSDIPRREPDLSNQIEEHHSANPEAEKELARVNEERERREQELKREQALKQQRVVEQLRASKQQQQSSPPKISIAAFILLAPMRGGGSDSIPNLSIPAKTDYVAMQLQLESNDYTAYRIALADQSGSKNLWLSRKLKTKNKGENQVLNIRFPAKLLKSQIYSLVVSGIGSDGSVEIISNYPFRAVLK